jgi:inner membrane protein
LRRADLAALKPSHLPNDLQASRPLHKLQFALTQALHSSFVHNNGAFMKNTFFLKILSLGAVGFLLFIFLIQIQHIIFERQQYRDQAVGSVSQTVAGSQTLLGPIVHMACTETREKKVKDADGTRSVEEQDDHLLTATPLSLHVQANVQVEPRSRSIYNAHVLSSKAILKAQFIPGDALKPKAVRANSRMQCGSPILMVSMDDPRGIRSASVKINGQEQALKAGTFHPTYKRGMHLQLPPALATSAVAWDVEIAIDYVGTKQLGIVPLGETTTVRMESNWPHPSFTGRFAPSQRSIKVNQGFEANWRLTSVATDAAEAIKMNKPLCGNFAQESAAAASAAAAANAPTFTGCVESMNVGFVEPINFYSLSDRASKYGLLFVALTFVGLGLFEVMKQLRVHPLQYLLAGAAICTFFLLLVSLSEHIGFMLAYASGASATVLLLTYYARFMLGSWARSLPFGLGMGLLYSMLYVLLQLEQTALAVGSVALFAVLAVVMVCTRKIDWYALLATPAKPLPASDIPAADAAQNTLWKDEK